MSAKRNGLLALLTAALFVATGMMANAQEPETTDAIDYSGFYALVGELEPVRAERLIDLDTFNAWAGSEDTLILDTRSASAFAAGHIEGAVNLPFSDFTDAKLAEVIPSTDTRILIYCNNNFTDNVAPVIEKRVELALNVPTFINLYGSGYENLYELGDRVSIADPDVHWLPSL